MSIDQQISDWFNKLNEFCKNKSFKLSDHWNSVVKGIIKKNGNCPCRLGSVPCPCPFHEDEINENGKCHCGLFVKT